MDAIIWNVRSVNTMQAFERLILLHKKHHFEFIGIMEPMQQANKVERYRSRIGLAQAVVNVSNKIWAFIDEVYEVDIVYNMVQQLTLKLFHTETHVELILTLVYAKCDHIERIELWDSLYAMASDMTSPWLVGGDFNVIWDEEEKFGGLPVSINEVDDFRHCINTCNLSDLGFKGSIFTWWNGRSEDDCIFKRLDRCFGNIELQQTFPGLEVTHMSKTGSDHCPMLLKCDIENPPIKKPFRFLNFWTKHEAFKTVVKENWNADFSANPFVEAVYLLFVRNPQMVVLVLCTQSIGDNLNLAYNRVTNRSTTQKEEISYCNIPKMKAGIASIKSKQAQEWGFLITRETDSKSYCKMHMCKEIAKKKENNIGLHTWSGLNKSYKEKKVTKLITGSTVMYFGGQQGEVLVPEGVAAAGQMI
ncbi:PREDICTED: uncharacterized protein LOC109222093, partial [Nicotiana attenuata]|uniref:uncharacterized protein LOC109222093 n=1 Tax=Nicotiana attenuata TaxID=49451 RepID=UPI000905B916